MTDQRDLDRILASFFVTGTDELADRVIEAALDQIDHTSQRRALRLQRTAHRRSTLLGWAAAAVAAVVVVAGTLYVSRPGPSVGGPSATPSESGSVGPTGPMAVARQIQTSTLLGDGRVLVAGGFDAGDAALATAELYDPTTRSFSTAGSMTVPRGIHTATLLLDGRVLITGGGPASWLVTGPFLASAELYDPETGRFSPTGSMTMARTDHTATLLSDGRVLVTGGNDVGDHGMASAEIYDPTTGTFRTTDSMTTARGFHTATLLLDGRVLIVGGDPTAWTDSVPFLASAEIYDPTTGTFTATGPMPFGRAHHTATRLADGRVLITGGTDLGGVSLDSGELYDPATGTFSPTGAMTDGRVYQTATLLGDGRVLIVGGSPRGVSYANRPFLASAEIFDPTTGTFTATGSMTDRRTYHAATLLADGRVLVTGGWGDQAPLSSAEIYDPQTGTFSPVIGR